MFYGQDRRIPEEWFAGWRDNIVGGKKQALPNPFGLLCRENSVDMDCQRTFPGCIRGPLSSLCVSDTSGPMQVIFACATVGIVPVSCCVYSIKDPWDIRKNISYVLTNYRAVTIHRRGEYSLWLNPDTPLRTEQWEDGAGILYLGDACRISPLESRQKTVMGIREDESDQRKVTGLVFYGIDDPKKVGQKICSSGTCGEKSNIL